MPLFVAEAAPICGGVHAPTSNLARSQAVPAWARIKSLKGKIDHVVQTFSPGSPNFYLARDFSRTISKLDETAQSEWLMAIGQAYRKVPKKNPNPLAPRLVGGRRLLDRALTEIENYQQKFADEISQGTTPAEAYRKFMDRQSQLFGGSYNAREVQIVISTLQAQILELPEAKRARVSLLITGSFPNGKADLQTSDIDLSLSDGSLQTEVTKWQAAVDSAFEQAGMSSKPKIEISIEGTQFYGKLNPVIIQVTANEVHLLVFPPGTAHQTFDDFATGTPQIYKLQ